MRTTEKLYYDFFVDLHFYAVCPESMQTVSLVERVIKQGSFIWMAYNTPFSVSDLESLNRAYENACLYIEGFFGKSVHDDLDVMKDWTFDTFLTLLKSNARSKQVKNYFGL